MNLLQHRVPKTCCIFHFATSLGDNYIGIEGYRGCFCNLQSRLLKDNQRAGLEWGGNRPHGKAN